MSVKNVSLYFILNIVLIYSPVHIWCTDRRGREFELYIQWYSQMISSSFRTPLTLGFQFPLRIWWSSVVHPRVHKPSPGVFLVMAIYPFAMPDGWFLYVYKMWAVSCSAKWLNYTIKFNFTSGYYVQQRYRPWKNERCLFLEGARRKLIRGCSENRRKGIIYYFQIKISMYAVISHSITFTT